MIIKRHNLIQTQELQLQAAKKEGESYLKTTLNSGDKVTLSLKTIKGYELDEEDEPLWAVASDACHVQGDVVEGLGITGKALMASTVLSGVGAVGLLVAGSKDLKEGIKEKNFFKALGGTSALIASASSGADCLVNIIEAHELLGTTGASISHVLEPAGKALGITHGTLDMVLGGRELINGIKAKNTEAKINGAFEMGIGGTMVMGGLGIGGHVTAAVMGTLFAAKIAYNYREEIAGAGKKIINKIKGEGKTEEIVNQ